MNILGGARSAAPVVAADSADSFLIRLILLFFGTDSKCFVVYQRIA
jgi:hypothetical protein